jgi:hypothetical protein
MRVWQSISRILFAAAILSLLISLVVALGPGHRFRTPLVNADGLVDRTALLDGDDYNRQRALDEIERLLIDQETHLAADRTSGGLLLLSWVLLASALGARLPLTRHPRPPMIDEP